MPQRSAGVLLYRNVAGVMEVFLVHPGGPFWAKKDDGAWTIPKGLVDPGEDALATARREFAEETGTAPGGTPALPLGDFKQSGGKVVSAFAIAGELDPATIRSNTFTMEWPPGSGRMGEFPEVDRGAWFRLEDARQKILKGQAPMLDALLQALRK